MRPEPPIGRPVLTIAAELVDAAGILARRRAALAREAASLEARWAANRASRSRSAGASTDASSGS